MHSFLFRTCFFKRVVDELERELILSNFHACIIDGRITHAFLQQIYTATYIWTRNYFYLKLASLDPVHAMTCNVIRLPAHCKRRAMLPLSWRLQCSSFPIIYDL